MFRLLLFLFHVVGGAELPRSILSWNVGLEEQWADQRVPAILQTLRATPADVACLIEVWGGPQRLDHFTETLRDVYPYSVRVPTPIAVAPCPDVGPVVACVLEQCNLDDWIMCLLSCLRATIPVADWQADPCWACLIEQAYRVYAKQEGLVTALTACQADVPWAQTLGLLILARSSITLVDWGFYQSLFVPRGYLTVRLGGVNLTCTHLTVPGLPYPYPLGATPWTSWATENLGQTQRLLQVVNQSQVIMGDFNHGPAAPGVSAVNSVAYDLFRGAGWYDCYVEVGAPLCTACSDDNVSPTIPPAIYDHIWTRLPCTNESRVVRTHDQSIRVNNGGHCLQTWLSDHYALLRTTTYVPADPAVSLCISAARPRWVIWHPWKWLGF